jgi:flagellar basal body-associated protein FliL
MNKKCIKVIIIIPIIIIIIHLFIYMQKLNSPQANYRASTEEKTYANKKQTQNNVNNIITTNNSNIINTNKSEKLIIYIYK